MITMIYANPFIKSSILPLIRMSNCPCFYLVFNLKRKPASLNSFMVINL